MHSNQPLTLTFDITPSGARRALAHYPLSAAMQVRSLPATLEHDGLTYVPFTGTVVTERRVAKYHRPVGYYLEYRALRPTHPTFA